MPSVRLDIIGRVAFGYDFKAGQSTEAQQIRASWEGHVNSGIQFGAFIAMLVIRACPSVFLLPLPAIKAGGRIREIVSKLSMRLLRRGAFNDRGRDILSILMKNDGVRAAKEERLTPQQVVDNVRIAPPLPFWLRARSARPELSAMRRRPCQC